MHMGTYDFNNKIEKYTEEARKNLEKIKEIADVKKQCREISSCLSTHKRYFNELKIGEPEEYIGNSYPWKGKYSLNNYEKEIKKIEELEKKLLKKSSQLNKIEKSSCNKCKKKRTKKMNRGWICQFFLWRLRKQCSSFL